MAIAPEMPAARANGTVRPSTCHDHVANRVAGGEVLLGMFEVKVHSVSQTRVRCLARSSKPGACLPPERFHEFRFHVF
jgi:hypothetical protein